MSDTMRVAAMAVLPPSRIRIPVFLVALATLAALALGAGDEDLAPPAPIWAGQPEVVPGLEELSCAECHADVTNEWKSTLHALSWVDETYRDDLKKKRKPQGCWGCHAPSPLAPDWPKRPKPRDDDRHLGVTCETCHRGPDGGILGPWGLATDAHTSTRSERFVGDGTLGLCTSCHATSIGPVIGIAKGFDPESERTCVECHMAPVERELSDGTKRLGRSHALQTPRDPAFLARAFAVTFDPESAVIRIANQAGHRIPGLLERSFTFTAEVYEGERRTARERTVIDADSWLPVGAEVSLPLELDQATMIRLRAEHDDPRLKRTVEFLQREFPLR